MNTTEKELLSKLEKEYLDKISSYTKKLESVRVLLSDESVATTDPEQPKTETHKPRLYVPTDFSTELPQKLQVLFALNKLGGEAFASDVAVELQHLNPNLSLVVAKKLATQKLSELKINDKFISYTSVGTKHKYKIKGAT